MKPRKIPILPVVVTGLFLGGIALFLGHKKETFLDINSGRKLTRTSLFSFPVREQTEETWLSEVVDPERTVAPDLVLIVTSEYRFTSGWQNALSYAHVLRYGRDLDLLTDDAFEALCDAMMEGWSRTENVRDINDTLRELGDMITDSDEPNSVTLADVEPYLTRLRDKE